MSHPVTGVIDHDWVEAHQGLSMSLLFTLGYVGIMVEELVGLNKAGVALLMAVSLWTIRSTGGDTQVGVGVCYRLCCSNDRHCRRFGV